MAPAVSLSSESFISSQGSDVTSYALLLKVSVFGAPNMNGRNNNGEVEGGYWSLYKIYTINVHYIHVYNHHRHF